MSFRIGVKMFNEQVQTTNRQPTHRSMLPKRRLHNGNNFNVPYGVGVESAGGCQN